MADETPEQPEGGGAAPQVDAALEADARRNGWRPKGEFRGPEQEWVDAATFMRRSNEILPHVRNQLQTSRQENETLRQQQAAQAQELATLREQVAGLTEFRADASRRERDRIRSEVWAEIEAAREAGDIVREARAMDRLPSREEPARRTDPPAGGGTGSGGGGTRQPPALNPELQAWVASNDWYRTDPVLQTAMNSVSAELRAAGKLVGMSLTESLNETARVVLQRYSPAATSRSPSVEGGARPAGGSGGGGGGSAVGSFQEAWDRLPAQVKVECDAQGKRLGLVGEKKTFKTQEAWRKHFLQQYGRYAEGVGYNYRPVEDTRPEWMQGT
jgi:hypothetical protein